jgi:hypothetical protein
MLWWPERPHDVTHAKSDGSAKDLERHVREDVRRLKRIGTARTQDTANFPKMAICVGDVLEDVEAQHQVERTVAKGQTVTVGCYDGQRLRG